MSGRCCSQASYVVLQVGRNAAAALLLKRRHRLRDVFERLVVWSVASGVLWLAGATLDGDQRLALWIPALALELAAPAAGYWLPRRGRAATTDYDIEGGHFAERCQLFIIIALGESIVVTGATASAAGLTSTVVVCLVVAFVADRGAVVAVLRRDRRAGPHHAEHLRGPRSPRARRLHLPPPADHRRHHRDRGRHRPAHRRTTPRPPRGRPGDDPRRPRALPGRGEPVHLADDRDDERQSRGGRGTARICSCRSAARSAPSCSASSSPRCCPRSRSGSCGRVA